MLLLLSIVAGGCAGHEQYTVARRQMDAGEHAAAVASLREAVRQNPGNIEYQMRLSDAETAAAEQHVAWAEQRLAEGRDAEARRELETALTYMPGHPRAIVLLRQLQDRAAPGDAHAALPERESAVAGRSAPLSTSVGPTRGHQAAAASDAPAGSPAPAPPSTPATPPPTAAAADGVWRATLSRGDARYPSETRVVDGIGLRLHAVGREPLRADVEIRVGEAVRGYRGLRVGTRLTGRGVSGARYRLEILSIDPRTETISLRLDRIDE